MLGRKCIKRRKSEFAAAAQTQAAGQRAQNAAQCGGQQPGKALGIQGQALEEGCHRAAQQICLHQRAGHAYQNGEGHRHRIAQRRLAGDAVGKTQRDEHDGHRVDGAQDGHRDGQNGVQPGDGNKEADHREDDHPGPVGDFGPLQAEVFAAAAEQADAGVQA